MYWESVLLLTSMAVVVPYACFSLVNSLMNEDAERKYGSKAKTVATTLVIPKAKVSRQEEKKGGSALVKLSKQESALVKTSIYRFATRSSDPKNT
ncbi:MAG: hypothetical protein RMK91_12500 [Pseudanabaenaceae cyanobacterium SKYGB_i_bin29]|nr:hypothetical protein [Pseudanabaenaceae cyanobacterium SKYG29]MDW8422674.1 hypothetical protein [Pseudanabaenaceae cyanobacterium SKYGB_i_bin29]